MPKKLTLTFSTLLISTLLFAQKYSGDTWSSVKKNGKGTLAVVYYEQPGLIYNQDGKIKGVCAEIMDDFVEFVKKQYGATLSVNYAGKEAVFTEFLNVTKTSNTVLGVTNVTITPERKQLFKFTPPFLSNPIVFITHNQAPAVYKFEDLNQQLKGYSAAVIASSTHVKHIEKIKKEYMPDLKIIPCQNGKEVLKKITDNPKIFTILDFTEFADATKSGIPVKKQPLTVSEAEQLGFIMSKQSDWDAPWNEFMTPAYTKSVKYRKIILDNLGAPFLTIMK